MEGWPSPVLLGAAVFAVFLIIVFVSRAIRAPAVGKHLRDAMVGDQWGQINGDQYLNGKHGISLSGLNDWISQPLSSEFENDGGFLVLQAPDGNALLTFASGPLRMTTQVASVAGNRKTFIQQWERRAFQQLDAKRSEMSGDAIKRIPLSAIHGESEVLRIEFTCNSGTVGNVWALHQGDEYVLTYTMLPASTIRVEEVLKNWEWFLRLRGDETGLRRRSW
jgi:hypothetical protein